MVIEILAYFAVVFAVQSEIGFPIRWLVDHIPIKPIRWFFSKLVQCYFCSGFWLSMVSYRRESNWKDHILESLAIGTAVYALDVVLKALETYTDQHDGKPDDSRNTE